MARKKKTSAQAEKQPLETQQSRYPNFLLALTFIVVVLLLLSLFLRNSGAQLSLDSIKNLFTRSNSPSPTQGMPKPNTETAVAGEQYVVQEGDTLWSIAEEAYGSGFNAEDVIAANDIQNPEQLEEGTVIEIPQVEVKDPTRGEAAGEAAVSPTPEEAMMAKEEPQVEATKEPKADTYTVKAGDSLWTIAMEAYGNPYMWSQIAEANNLANPDIIHAGNKFTLPPARS